MSAVPEGARTVGELVPDPASRMIALDVDGTLMTPDGFISSETRALVAALLNAAFGFCLGCELYLLGRRALPARTS